MEIVYLNCKWLKGWERNVSVVGIFLKRTENLKLSDNNKKMSNAEKQY